MTPAAFVRSLPSSIRIGPHDISIVVRKLDDCEGTFTSSTSSIELRDEPSSKTVAVDTLLHEVNHALFWTCALPQTGNDEEPIAGALATGWTQVYRDNPWLLGWIKKGLQ